ncbi:MAG TPA: hypothetical protein VJ276_26190 [Thermoanaerobaculia bacterium]|nr:hypothetical protein [Thermoanaerobaculia bacterium]
MKRGAKVLGELAGFGATSAVGHVTDPSADGAARAIRQAVRDTSLEAKDIGYINAHGTATRANDATETAAINLAERDPERDLDYVPNEARQGRVGAFLSNSFGFGGMNGVLAVRVSGGT